MKNKYLYILLCFLFCLSSLQAQVSLGSTEAPAKAALLEIKDINPQDPAVDNTTATTGGMGMPRVNLVDMETLEPFINPSDADYAQQKILHTGLLVYNIATLSADIAPGIYCWNGAHWEPLIASSVYFNLNVSPLEINFPTNIGMANPIETVLIDWEPSSIPCKLSLIPVLRGGIKGYVPPLTTDVSGNQTLSIQVDAMTQAEVDVDPFLERASRLHIAASDGVGGYKQEDVILRQINYALLVRGFREKIELGQTHTFTLASNSNWDVAVDDPNGILEKYRTTSGGNNILGEDFTLKVKDDNTKEGFSATLTFSNPDAKFQTQVYTVTATKYYPNSYIVPVGGFVDIPIRKAYNVWAQELGIPLPASAVTTELVWQDAPSLITSIALKTGDLGIDSEIRVNTSGSIPAGGNALVAVKVGGIVRWSWHIWVTNYNPNSAEPLPAPSTNYQGTPTNVTGGKIFNYNNGISSTVFMDRNLGATNALVGDSNYNQYGYLYQWGRKDPFPGLKYGSLNNTYVHRTLYDAANVVLTAGSPSGGTGINNITVAIPVNLQNSIVNPKTFYCGTAENDHDWYSASAEVHNNSLWNDENGAKGIYDPCPTGWRVPITTDEYNSPWIGLAPVTPNFGFDWTAQGAGYYPFAGYKSAYTGMYDSATGRGLYSSYATKGAFKYAFYIDPTNASYGPYTRGQAESIRCVKEK